jgi:hypothetical protein
VNTLRTTVADVCGMLERSGFIKEDSAVDYSNFAGHRYDVHLNDVIVFPRDTKFDVYNHGLVQCGFLVVQVIKFCWDYFTQKVGLR